MNDDRYFWGPTGFSVPSYSYFKLQATEMSLQIETLKLWVVCFFWKDEVGRGKKLSFQYWFCLQKMN